MITLWTSFLHMDSQKVIKPTYELSESLICLHYILIIKYKDFSKHSSYLVVSRQNSRIEFHSTNFQFSLPHVRAWKSPFCPNNKEQTEQPEKQQLFLDPGEGQAQRKLQVQH